MMSSKKVTKAKNQVKSDTIKVRNNSKHRAADRKRSESMDSKTEEQLLLSSDDEAVAAIESLSNEIDEIEESNLDNAMEAESAVADDNASNNDVFKLLNEIRKDQIRKSDLTDFKKEIKSAIGKVDTKLKSQDNRIDLIETKVSKFEGSLSSINYELENQKQLAIKNNISIVGIPKSAKEDPRKTVLLVCQKLQLQISEEDIVAVYRTSNKASNFSSIIVKFEQFASKKSVLDAKSKKKLSLFDIIKGEAANKKKPVYLNNHLTPFFARLFSAGRQAVKEKRIHSCWIASNGCLMKQNENDEPKVIRSIDDLDKYKSSAGSSKRSKPDHNSPGNSNSNNQKQLKKK